MREYIYETFAEKVGLPVSALTEGDPTLADLIQRSPKLVNSVDLMEAFARTANALKRDHGVKVRLGAFPLDTPISRVFDAFMAEIAAKEAS